MISLDAMPNVATEAVRPALDKAISNGIGIRLSRMMAGYPSLDEEIDNVVWDAIDLLMVKR
jgi:hypothetical protein